MRILVAEDDVRLAGLLEESLREAGWRVEVVHNGRVAYDRLLGDTSFDVVLLDWMLPGMDGVTVARRLRGIGMATPILMLTARGDVRDRIDGLDAGADDYLPKPFDVKELIARVEALAKRGRIVTGRAPGDLVLDPARHALLCEEREALLTPTEFRMLAAITSRPGEVVRRRMVVAAAWPNGGMVSENTVDSYIRRIRVKLRQVGSPLQLTTVRGVGYTLR